jgi:hypothetical protein
MVKTVPECGDFRIKIYKKGSESVQVKILRLLRSRKGCLSLLMLL